MRVAEPFVPGGEPGITVASEELAFMRVMADAEARGSERRRHLAEGLTRRARAVGGAS